MSNNRLLGAAIAGYGFYAMGRGQLLGVIPIGAGILIAAKRGVENE